VRLRSALLSFVLVAFLVVGPAPTSQPGMASHGGALDVGYMNTTTEVDGVLGPGEYSGFYTDEATGITIAMQYSGSVLGIGLEVPGIGWVAVSLGAVLAGSNYTDVLFFTYRNGTLTALDEVDHGWERHLDVAIGGTDDIIASALTLRPGGYILEFQIPLDSADDNDHHFLPNGTYPFSLAFNATSPDPASPDTAHSSVLFLHIAPSPMIHPGERTFTKALPGRAIVGQKNTLAAELTNQSGAPLSGQPVEFYLKTTYGLLYLGLGRTNNLGKAGIAYEPKASGTWTLYVVFRGTGRYLPSNDSVELVVLPAPVVGGAWIRVDTAIALVVLVVVGGVWGSYAYVVTQILAIRRSARRHLTRLSSQEGRGGEKDG